MTDPDRSRADAASADDVVESPSRQRGEVFPAAGDDTAGPGDAAGAPAAGEQAGDDWVPL